MSVVKYAKDLELEFGSSRIQAKGRALVVDAGVTTEEVEEALMSISTLDMCTSWWIGDLSLQAEEIIGEEYHHIESVIAEKTGLDLDTIKRYRQTCQRYKPKERMNISFTHHRIVETLEKKLRKELLVRAINEGISANDLKKIVKAMKPSTKKDNHDYVICQHNLKDQGEIDMGTLYEKMADTTNRTFTHDELISLGLCDVNDNSTVYLIIRKPTIDPDEEEGEEVEGGENNVVEEESMDSLCMRTLEIIKAGNLDYIGVSAIQQPLAIGYQKAQDVLEELEARAQIGEPEPNEKMQRKVLIEFEAEPRAF